MELRQRQPQPQRPPEARPQPPAPHHAGCRCPLRPWRWLAPPRQRCLRTGSSCPRHHGERRRTWAHLDSSLFSSSGK
eukprot:10242905-Alexandrium_andersonii.AAC.1